MDILKRQDWYLTAAVLFLVAASLVVLSSINTDLFWQQLIWILLGLSLFLIFSLIDWRPIINYRWMILAVYLFAIILLLITYFLAPSIRGTRSWLVAGPIQFQTSEIGKLALIILLAYFFASRHIGIARLGIIVKSFIYFLIPAVFVLSQPDLGTALILFFIWFGFLLVSGIRWRHLLIGFAILALTGLWGWNFFLKDYQKERIIAFTNPSYDPLGVNYSAIQAKIAIGSGGFWGKGFGQGTQVQLGFLPAASTDFIFASLVEEWGGLGGFLTLGAFTFLLLRIVAIGFNCHNNFSKLICLGAVIMFLCQFILNVGSNLGLSPVIGVTFPFLSYGGSSLLTNFMLIGIIQSIVIRSSFFKDV
ncbi:MAG: FtsW/RodA/SpoVE family cell cycle protein [Patescibacteria group bacterium]